MRISPMFVSQKGGTEETQAAVNRTGVISCRLPCGMKAEVERLARENGLVLSHVIRDFLEEGVRRGDLAWWSEETPVEDVLRADEGLLPAGVTA